MVSASCTGQYSRVPPSPVPVSLETRGAPSQQTAQGSLLGIKQLIPALEINEVRNLKH